MYQKALTFKEVAEKFDITENTVRKYVTKGFATPLKKNFGRNKFLLPVREVSKIQDYLANNLASIAKRKSLGKSVLAGFTNRPFSFKVPFASKANPTTTVITNEVDIMKSIETLPVAALERVVKWAIAKYPVTTT